MAIGQRLWLTIGIIWSGGRKCQTSPKPKMSKAILPIKINQDTVRLQNMTERGMSNPSAKSGAASWARGQLPSQPADVWLIRSVIQIQFPRASVRRLLKHAHLSGGGSHTKVH
jgi:hypothetical protein